MTLDYSIQDCTQHIMATKTLVPALHQPLVSDKESHQGPKKSLPAWFTRVSAQNLRRDRLHPEYPAVSSVFDEDLSDLNVEDEWDERDEWEPSNFDCKCGKDSTACYCYHKCEYLMAEVKSYRAFWQGREERKVELASTNIAEELERDLCQSADKRLDVAKARELQIHTALRFFRLQSRHNMNTLRIPLELTFGVRRPENSSGKFFFDPTKSFYPYSFSSLESTIAHGDCPNYGKTIDIITFRGDVSKLSCSLYGKVYLQGVLSVSFGPITAPTYTCDTWDHCWSTEGREYRPSFMFFDNKYLKMRIRPKLGLWRRQDDGACGSSGGVRGMAVTKCKEEIKQTIMDVFSWLFYNGAE